MDDECQEHHYGCRCREAMFSRAMMLLFEAVRRKKEMGEEAWRKAVYALIVAAEEWEETHGRAEEPR